MAPPAVGVRYARVNPRQGREFARASGRLAKTDAIDAGVLAAMGRALDLAPTRPTGPARRRLADLVARRSDIVAAISAETNRLAQAHEPFVRRDIQSHLAGLRRRKAMTRKCRPDWAMATSSQSRPTSTPAADEVVMLPLLYATGGDRAGARATVRKNDRPARPCHETA
jgi:transposase